LFSIIKEKSNDSEDYFMSCSYLAINNSKITDKFEFNDNYLKDNQKEIDSELNSLNARNLYNYLNKT